MSEYIEIDILKDEECFLCFDTSHSKFVTLQCCNRQNIHSQCLFQIFLNYLSLQNDKIACPLCRQEMSIKTYFTLDDMIENYTCLDEKCKKKFFPKFNNIITYNYIESNQVVQVDETTSTITVTNRKFILRKYLSLFILLVLIIVGSIVLYNIK